MVWLPAQVSVPILAYQSVATGLSPAKAAPSMMEPRTEPSGLPGPTPCSFTLLEMIRFS